MAISSSNFVKWEPDCLLHNSATPITSSLSLMGKHKMFLKRKYFLEMLQHQTLTLF